MACGFDKGLIAAHYDGEITPAERLLVDRHLATCSECAADLSAMRELSASLKPLKGAAAPMSIAEGVMREVGSARRVHRPWVSWGLSAAAAVFLAVGTVYMLDRSGSPGRHELVTASERRTSPAPSAKPSALKEENSRDLYQGKKALDIPAEESRRDALGDKDHAEIPPAPPSMPPPPAADRGAADGKPAPPAAEPEKRQEEGRRVELTDKITPEKKRDEAATALGKDKKKPVTPVLRVTSADQTAARAEVEAFLKERKLMLRPAGEPLLGRSREARYRYLQVELSEEELKALQERLTGLKGTEVTAGSFEEEKKRVAEEEAKRKNALGPRAGEDDKDAGKTDPEEKEAPKPETSPDQGRGMALADAPKRKTIILVFEPPPAKK
ncbi:MAG TPA: zf-HC2 domain-containing protein [Planctomycetota bacterium]|nr:zf-HC2 domain-containing protein [Planctomycetota bacterium]